MNGYQPRPRPGTDGHLLTRAREARGWGRTETARRLRDFSTEAGHPISPGRDGIWYWEHSRSPDRATQALIAGLLGIPPAAVDERPWPEWLAEDPAQRPAPRPWTPAGAADALSELAGGSVDHTRRELILIAGGTLTAALLSWLIADPDAAGQIASGRSIGEATVTRLEERTSTLRRIDDEDGGGTVLTETASALALTVSLIRDRSYASGHGARLYAVASDLARQRAAAMFDVHGECADGTFETALRAAKAGGDDALGANCLAFWANAAYNTGRPHDAEAMASTALAAVRGRTTPRVQAMLESRRGRARARLGDHACWASFDQAEQLLSQADSHADPDWAYWFDQAEIYGARASSHLDLGQPALAEKHFITARELFDPSIVRTQALYLTRQAIAQADQGHIDQAAATGTQALDMTQSISSSRTTSLLADLAGTLGPHRTASAQDFCERARTVLTDLDTKSPGR
jgi:tetratricopeptide (TPR) repeat protein/transcriptional regulator with XRE-family HTH domain